ncbi:MAG: LicD family protein [Dehalococcoidales bacterium]|nr:LicD family protein [Dehalococcoidales bacterium]
MNKLMVKIARSILLSHYVRKVLERIYRFYAIARFEEGLDPFAGGYYSRPWIATPVGRTMNMGIAEKNLLDIKRILDKEGIRFWLMFGTFLGAYRDHDIISYDEDTDLAICAEDLPRLLSCEAILAKEGFYLGLAENLVTLYRSGEHTDFYLFRLNGTKRVNDPIKFDVDAFETYCEVQFLGEKWRILSEPERWLKYTYGEDWRAPIKGKGIRDRAYGEEFESG